MARTASTSLKAHLASENTTLATCWKITRTDSTVMGFTDHVDDISFSGVDYIASSGFQPTDVLQRDDMSVDNMEVAGILDSNYITETDIQAGIYDFAEIEIFMVNYEDLTQGRMWLKRGWIGEVKMTRGQFEAEVRGLSQKFSQHIGRLFAPSCDAIFGDARCGVALGPHTAGVVVSSVQSSAKFTMTTSAGGPTLFKGGEVQWLTGNNAGLKMEIKEFTDDSLELVLAMSKTVQAGDTANVIAGCDKSFSTCRDRFSNALNFRGFPDVPGQDKMLETNGTFTTTDES